MRAIADRFGIKSFEYTNISPTVHGGGEVLPSRVRRVLSGQADPPMPM